MVARSQLLCLWGSPQQSMTETEKLIAEWDRILSMLRSELLACSNEKRKNALTRRIDKCLDEKNRLSKEGVGAN
jgi:hypothetical protein